jgi:hypothetical protein
MNHKRFDVVVAGGGLAGVAAAVAAARLGASTLLVERQGWLGGLGVVGATGWHSFFNIYHQDAAARPLRLVRGIAQELVDRIQAAGGGIGHIEMERGGDFVSRLTPVEPEVAKHVLAQVCVAAGVELLLHTAIVDVDAVDTPPGRSIQSVLLWNVGGFRQASARAYVDCTGDGVLARDAGAEVVRFAANDPGAYAAGFSFRLCNVDLARLEADLERRGAISQLAHAVKPGCSAPDLVRLGIDMAVLRAQGMAGTPRYFLSSSLRPGEITYCNCLNHGPNDGLDAAQLTAAELDLRAQMLSVAAMFRDNLDGCQQSYPAGASPVAGQRRALAVRCDYELTQEDCTVGRTFADQIGCFGFIDNARFNVQGAGYFGIPYRALLPRGMANLLIAGRMMTVDSVAHNATRNTVACLVGGQAAGVGAALAALSGLAPRDLSPDAIRQRLDENGALLTPEQA